MHDTALLVTVFAVVGLVGLNALSYYSMKRLVLPNVVWVLLIGVIYGALARFTNLGFPRIGLKPDLILWLFVPLLIFSSTQKICLSHLRRVLLPASLAATIGVLISMLVIAGALHFGFQIGWLEALLFGAILSATDPLAIGALLDGNSRVSESQRLLIEGESILNDGFVVTVAGTIGTLLFTGGKFDLTESIMYFEIEVLGALLTGLILGRGARGVLVAPQLEWDLFVLTTNITLALSFGSYALAESLGLSGILAVFAAALAFGYKKEPDNHNKHVQRHLWLRFKSEVQRQ